MRKLSSVNRANVWAANRCSGFDKLDPQCAIEAGWAMFVGPQPRKGMRAVPKIAGGSQ